MKKFNIIDYTDKDLIGKAIDTFKNIKISEIPFDGLRQADNPLYTLVKATHTRSVAKFTNTSNNNVILYAKRHKARNWLKIIVTLFRKTKSRREWEIGFKLIERDIVTALPIIYAEKKIGPFVKEDFLVLKGIDKAVDVKNALLQCSSYQQKRDFTRQLAAYFRYIHHTGFYHDDCSSEHILVEKGAVQFDSNFYLIDLDNSKLLRTVPFEKRAKNIFQFFRSINKKIFSNSLRVLFLKEYISNKTDTYLLRRYMIKLNKYSLWKDKKKLW